MLSSNTNRNNQRITITISTAKVKICGGRYVEWMRRGITSRILDKTKDKFQCIWVAMIGELYELIAEYLGKWFR